MNSYERRTILLVCLFSTISFFLIDFYLPSFPSITRNFGAYASNTKMMVSCYLVGISFSQLIYGILSDKYGRKRILLIGIVIGMLANFMTIFATSIDLVLALRFLTGLGAGACPALSRASLSDCFQGPKLLKSNSYLSMSITMSPAIAPVIGGLLQEGFGWKISFIFVSGWCALTILLLCFLFKETLPDVRRIPINVSSVLNNYKKLLSSNDFLISAGVSCLAISACLSYYIVTPFIFQNEFHLSAINNGSIYILNAIANLIGAYYINHRSKNTTPETLLKQGSQLAFYGALVMLLISMLGFVNIYVIVLPMLIINFAFGIIMPSTGTIAIRKFKSSGGSCAAMLGFVRMGGSALITGGVALLKINTQLLLSLVLLLIFSVVYMLLALTLKSLKPELALEAK